MKPKIILNFLFKWIYDNLYNVSWLKGLKYNFVRAIRLKAWTKRRFYLRSSLNKLHRINNMALSIEG